MIEINPTKRIYTDLLEINKNNFCFGHSEKYPIQHAEHFLRTLGRQQINHYTNLRL